MTRRSDPADDWLDTAEAFKAKQRKASRPPIRDRLPAHTGDVGKSAAASPITLAQLTASQTPTQWVVDELLARGSAVLLASESGVGKTSLCYAAAAAVAGGTPFLGQFAAAQGRVLIVQADESQQNAQAKLRAMGIDSTLPISWFFPSDDPTWSGFDGDRIARMIAEQQAALVVLDSVTSLLAGDGSTMMRDPEFAKPLYRLNKVAADLGSCILIPAHLKKPESGSRSMVQMADIIGSSAQVAGVSDVLALWKHAKPEYPEHAVLAALGKRNLTAGTHWHLSGDREDFSWQLEAVDDGDLLPFERHLLATDILECLHQSPQPLTASQIADAISCNAEHARRTLISLYTAGRIGRMTGTTERGRPPKLYHSLI